MKRYFVAAVVVMFVSGEATAYSRVSSNPRGFGKSIVFFNEVKPEYIYCWADIKLRHDPTSEFCKSARSQL